MLPGVNKLDWGAPKHQTDFYTRDALRCCKEVAAAVAELKAGSAAVAATCGLFRDALLVRVDRKRLHDLPDFEQRQAAHQVRSVCGECLCVWFDTCGVVVGYGVGQWPAASDSTPSLQFLCRPRCAPA